MQEDSSKKRILVVDDEAKIRSLIRKYAEFEGYSVVEAANGMEVLDLIGFKGDITAISYTDAEDASAGDYTMILRDAAGKDFYIRKALWESNQCVQGLKIADEQMKVLYEESE